MDPEQIGEDIAERVRGVIAEAQERAAKIVREAEDDAKRVREAAEAQARERLAEVRAALEDLQGRLGADAPSQAEAEPGPVTVPEPEPPASPEPEPPPIPEPMPPPDEADPPSASANDGEPDADKAAARLVAMKMALDGAPRDEIDAHIAENYDVPNREKLLDDVLARAKA
ncbi:MAG: hypothetical protein ABI726_08950 [bacterium]